MENSERSVKKPVGLAPVRTARVIASLLTLMGMVLLLMQRVLAAVLTMANEAVAMGFARYSNFTGRMALQNFPEDRQLFKLLKDVQEILPMAETALTVLLLVSVVFLLVALAGLAFPRQFVHVLVALKWLKWGPERFDADDSGDLRRVIANIGNIPLKKIAVPLAAVLVVVGAGFGISSCREKVAVSSVADAVEEMQQQASVYISAQRSYFAQKKMIGNAKALNLDDTLSTDRFSYKVTASRFVAVSKVPLADCPAGTKWYVSASTKGVFDKELVLYRALPKDSSCANLTPDFKNLGRK